MVDTSTQNPLPVVGPSYNDQLLTFLAQEDADRFTDMLNPFVVENGLHGTGGGLTGNPGNTVGYPEGFYTTEISSILYPDNTANNWVILFKDIVTDPGGNWVQVAGTHYWIDSVSGAQPAEPVGSLILMRVTTSGGSITVVDDLRNLNAFTSAGDRVKITISDTTARFLAAALVQGSNITLTTQNPAADETLLVAATDAKVTITTNDTTEGVLNDKLLVTAPLTKTTNNPGANETITLDINLIDTADIADNAVTLAKVAHGTADRVHGTDNSGIPVLAQLVENQIAADAVNWVTKIKIATAGDSPYYDASGDPQLLAKGTDGQVKTLASGIQSWANLPEHMEMFTASGTWTQPLGITKVLVEGCAGGGGGGGSATGGGVDAGGGAGGGSFMRAVVTVSGDITVTVGAKGIGVNANNGTAGTDTTVGALLTAKGGAGGNEGSPGSAGAGGVEGSTSGDQLESEPGNSGEAGSTGSFGGAGGKAGPHSGLADNRQSSAGNNGINGINFGDGGGGSLESGAQNLTGGDGVGGYVLVSW